MTSRRERLLTVANTITQREPVIIEDTTFFWANNRDFIPGLYVAATYNRVLGANAIQCAELRIIDGSNEACLRVTGVDAFSGDYEDVYAEEFEKVFGQYEAKCPLGQSVGLAGLSSRHAIVETPRIILPAEFAA